jgi:hypothetical protein
MGWRSQQTVSADAAHVEGDSEHWCRVDRGARGVVRSLCAGHNAILTPLALTDTFILFKRLILLHFIVAAAAAVRRWAGHNAILTPLALTDTFILICRAPAVAVVPFLLFVTQATADVILGATSVVCKLIDYIIAGTTAEEDGKPRAGVSIVVTTPSQIPSLPMFGGRTDTSIQAGDQVPGIQVVMYIQNTREHRVAHETLRTRAMDELINDLDKVLTDECQPLSGFNSVVSRRKPSPVSRDA